MYIKSLIISALALGATAFLGGSDGVGNAPIREGKLVRREAAPKEPDQQNVG